MKADPELDFEWQVARDGYEWIEMPTDVPDAKYPQQRVLLRPRTSATKAYRPLREYPELFREFAGTAASASELDVPAAAASAVGEPETRILKEATHIWSQMEGVRKFADRFGLLGLQNPLVNVDPYCFGRESAPVAEALLDWTTEIRRLEETTILLDLLHRSTDQENRRQHARLKTYIPWNDGVPSFWPDSHLSYPIATKAEVAALGWKPGERARPAKHLLRLQINDHLEQGCAPHVEWKPDNSKLRLSRTPRTLLGALWLQFATKFCEIGAYIRCQQCRNDFLVTHSRAKGSSRADSLFCGPACRQAEYRTRRREARTLRAQGKPIDEIATALRSSSETVRQWLGRRQR